jgi:hypothetical protein
MGSAGCNNKGENLAIACLLASTQAIRFSEPGSSLSFEEDEALVRPTMIAQKVMPGGNNNQMH